MNRSASGRKQSKKTPMQIHVYCAPGVGFPPSALLTSGATLSFMEGPPASCGTFSNIRGFGPLDASSLSDLPPSPTVVEIDIIASHCQTSPRNKPVLH